MAEERSASAVLMWRVDPMHRQPVLDIGDVEAQERTHVVEGDPALVHQPPDVSLRHSEPRR